MKDYNVVAYLNIEAEFEVQAENEDQAMTIIEERMNREDPLSLLSESRYIAVGDSGIVNCWELTEEE